MIITFMSDFGTEDGYVGSVKGVLLRKAPQATLVDITHDIPPFDVKRAAYTLINYYDQYPAGTVHLIVVDPGVGSERKPLIVQTERYFFVGPDNDVFTLLQKKEAVKIWRILQKKVNPEISNATFHGRDLFGPAAAILATGVAPADIAVPDAAENFTGDDFLKVDGNICQAEILAIDHFGNIVSALHADDLKRWKKSIKLVTFKNFKTDRVLGYYAQVGKGQPLALWNSLNFLEIAVREGNAARYFAANTQTDRIMVELSD